MRATTKRISTKTPAPSSVPPEMEQAKRRSPLRAAIVTVRPHQWIKNTFVAAPLLFSKHLLDPAYALRSAAALGLFCAVSAAVYALNDARDVEADRAHPVKRKRPIAAGELTERSALLMATGLATAALMAAAFISPVLALVLGGYLLNNLAYSLGLKQIAFLDVSMITAGFLLRVVGGAVAIGVEISPYLLICTGLLAALLGFGKRAHELIALGEDGANETRKALSGYSRRGLTVIMIGLAIATATAYALYTQNERTVTLFATRSLIYTLPFCVIGISRFLMLSLRSKHPRSPTEAMLRDPLFIANLSLWLVVVLTIVY